MPMKTIHRQTQEAEEEKEEDLYATSYHLCMNAVRIPKAARQT